MANGTRPVGVPPRPSPGTDILKWLDACIAFDDDESTPTVPQTRLTGKNKLHIVRKTTAPKSCPVDIRNQSPTKTSQPSGQSTSMKMEPGSPQDTLAVPALPPVMSDLVRKAYEARKVWQAKVPDHRARAVVLGMRKWRHQHRHGSDLHGSDLHDGDVDTIH